MPLLSAMSTGLNSWIFDPQGAHINISPDGLRSGLRQQLHGNTLITKANMQV